MSTTSSSDRPAVLVRRALGAATVAAFVVLVALGWWVGQTRSCLQTGSAPHAMVSLQLASGVREARAILDEWRAPEVAACARENLRRDDVFIVGYVVFGVVLTLLVGVHRTLPRWLVVASLVAVAMAGGLDAWVENPALRALLPSPDAGPPSRADIAWLRTAAQTKFALLLAALVVVSSAGLAAVRRATLRRGGGELKQRGFSDLVREEMSAIVAASGRHGTADPVVPYCPRGEPRVETLGPDLVGVALSGGGIRSATFNLGLLSGLARLGVLEKIDYLATVSGGGYLGSFWTAWLAQRGEGVPSWPAGSHGLEPGVIRHLREFSRFLAPRRGFFESETWQAVVVLLAGLLPSLGAAVSVIGLGLVGWLVTTFFLACPEPLAGTVTVLLLTSAVLFVLEHLWMAGSGMDAGDRPVSTRVNRRSAVAALLVVASVQWCITARSASSGPERLYWDGAWRLKDATIGAYEAWWRIAGIGIEPAGWFWSPRLYDLAVVWLAAGLLLLAVRPLVALHLRRGDAAAAGAHPRPTVDPLQRRVGLPAYDRTSMRLLGSAVAWAAVATLWHASINMGVAVKMIVPFLLSAGTFAALRNWIGTSLRTGEKPGLLARVRVRLPQLLAYVTIALMIGGVGAGLAGMAGSDWFRWYLLTAAMATLIVVMLLLDPTATGLHTFYRDRILRAYSGAVNPLAKGWARDNEQADVRAGDDLPLDERVLPARPLHLVCCAANDLHGDQVETLGRGARSAVLSRYGVSVGNWAVGAPGVTLGSAVTASAAAFNSNMGTVSTSLGPAVSFLMSALNLRLGLWTPNPANPLDPAVRLLPGVLFFREMFMRTAAGATDHAVHLSDGGHFDNLALYELVRRHCRYIIVSDCGADPTVAFDDFGSAARRIREDFGVEIDIDLSPLRPDAERRSSHHVVVGTIHYTKFDRGILLYVKPTLTGDESPDVLQYATRNASFPHETTTDQFYDESQWEAYRALGEHTSRTVFGFIERFRGVGPERPSADWIFTTAREEWFPTPPGFVDRVLEMTERFGAVEACLRETADGSLLQELFPELVSVHGTTALAEPPSPKTVADNLVWLVRMLQLMEDVWTRCDLDVAWSHPLNLGWVNCFARWTSAPTFRMWWPLLRPMYGPDFQRFIEERFGVLDREGERSGRLVELDDGAPSDGLAMRWWTQRHEPPPSLQGPDGERKWAYHYEIDLYRPARQPPIPVQVGIALVRHDRPGHVWWTSDDLFVPPSLWGAGIGGAFLHALLARLDERGIDSTVYVCGPRRSNDAAAWAACVEYVEFYKKQGFRIAGEEPTLPDGTTATSIRLERLPRAVPRLGIDRRATTRTRAAVPTSVETPRCGEGEDRDEP